jgi:putative transposase
VVFRSDVFADGARVFVPGGDPSRKVLSFRVSNTMTPDFCVDALSEAIARYGAPASTPIRAHNSPAKHGPTWSTPLGLVLAWMARGRWIDNVFIERLWCSVKYETFTFAPTRTERELQTGLTRYFDFYNRRRIHQSRGYQTPDEIYYTTTASELLAIAA